MYNSRHLSCIVQIPSVHLIPKLKTEVVEMSEHWTHNQLLTNLTLVNVKYESCSSTTLLPNLDTLFEGNS